MLSLNPFKKIAIIFVASLLPTLASAENVLDISDGINLIALNGKEVDSDSFFNNKTAYKLPNGINQIAVNYTAEIKKGGEYELEHTQVFVLLFETTNSSLTITAPKTEKLKDIKEFENKHNWLLVNKSGEKVSFKSSLIENSGFQLSRDYERELEEFNKTNSPAALPKSQLFSSTAIIKTNSATANNNNTKAKENIPAQMLLFWYNQADEATRKSFKELIINN